MSIKRTRNVPSFNGSDRLKFTAEEQQAIRSAELAFKQRSQGQMASTPAEPARHPLTLAILLALGLLFLSGLIVVFLNSLRSQEPVAESEMQMDDGVRRQAQLTTALALPVDHSKRVIFEDEISATNPSNYTSSVVIQMRHGIDQGNIRPNQNRNPQRVLRGGSHLDGFISTVRPKGKRRAYEPEKHF